MIWSALLILIAIIVVSLILYSIKGDENHTSQCLIPALESCNKIVTYSINSFFGKEDLRDFFPKYKDEDIIKYRGNLWMKIDFGDFPIELSNTKVYWETEIKSGTDTSTSYFKETVLFHGQIIKIDSGILNSKLLSKRHSIYKSSNYIYILINSGDEILYNSYENINKITKNQIQARLEKYLTELYTELISCQ